MGLLCAAFPDDGTPELPNARSKQECTKRRGALSSSTSSGPVHLADPVIIPTFPKRPQYEAAHGAPIPQQLGAQPQPGKQPQADYCDTLEDDIDPPEVDANSLAHGDQAITSAPDRVISPPPPELRQPTFTQAPRTNSSNGFGPKWPLKGDGDPWFGIGDGQMTYGDTDINVSFCDADAIEPSANSGLDVNGGGPMNVDGMHAARSPGADLEDMY
jgi:hypothetical protein